MAVTDILDYQDFLTQNPALSPIQMLYTRLLALGCDLFNKKALAQAVLGIADIDENKLRNILTCEQKRLHKFANEYSHDQHLLNLQSLFIKLLGDLIEKLSNPATSVPEFQRTLIRMVVLIDELDIAVAKAKRKKRLELDAVTHANHLEEGAIRIAADKSKDKDKDKNKNEYPTIPYPSLNDPLALLALLEKELKIVDYAKQACKQLPQYQLYVRRRRVEAVGGNSIEQQLRQIIENMDLNPNMQRSVLAESLRQSTLDPFQTPSLRRKPV